ncbi:hypothetical protein Vretimale_15998 [Volvox reticuliferus]|nr:hypothetical protein Vretimale_15998 [Volvox reticuliferus]
MERVNWEKMVCAWRGGLRGCWLTSWFWRACSSISCSNDNDDSAAIVGAFIHVPRFKANAYECKERQKPAVHMFRQAVLVAATVGANQQPHRPDLRTYNCRTRLLSTRIKITGEGAQPELISDGYRERIAAVVAAAGQQLEGVYVRRGCIELIVDTHSSEAASSLLAAAADSASRPAESRSIVGRRTVDQLVQSLQLPADPLNTRRRAAMAWHLPASCAVTAGCMASQTSDDGSGDDGGSSSSPDFAIASPLTISAVAATTGHNAEAEESAACPMLSVWPCAVYAAAPASSWTAAPTTKYMDSVVSSKTVRNSTSAPGCSTTPAATCATTTAPASPAAVETELGDTASFTVQTWWPCPGIIELDPEPPLLSARVGGALLSVVPEWGTIQVFNSATQIGCAQGGDSEPSPLISQEAATVSLLMGHNVATEKPRTGVLCMARRPTEDDDDPNTAPGADANVELEGGQGSQAANVVVHGDGCGNEDDVAALCGEGCLLSGTCRVQGVPPGAGLLLLQAHCPGVPEGLRHSRPVPVLLVDDPLVAAEVISAGGITDGNGPTHAEELEGFVIDLGVFMGGVSRRAGAPANEGCQAHDELLELQELGRHLHGWLCGTHAEMWPATTARLLRDLAAISDWLQVGPQEGPGVVAPATGVAREDSHACGNVGNGDCMMSSEEIGSSGRGDSNPKGHWVNPAGHQSQGNGNGIGRGESTGSGPTSEQELRSRSRLALSKSAGAALVAGGGCSNASDSSCTTKSLPAARSHSATMAAKAAGGGSPVCSAASSRRIWLQTVAQARAFAHSYGSLNDPGYQEFLTQYCAMQAPVLDVMFFISVGSVVLRTWQEEPQWQQRPLLHFLAHLAPCLVTLGASVLSTVTRPLLPRAAWARLVRACMVPRYLSFCLGLLLLGLGWTPPPAIAAYHQRGASVMMAEGVVLSATVVIMPATALLLAVLRIPAHVAVCLSVSGYDSVIAAMPYAALLAGCSVVTNLLLHAVLLTQYHRRVRRQAHGKAD